jgi:predicted GNAT family acetyltransferase
MIAITDNVELSRYEVTVDGKPAGYSDYIGYPDRRIVTHTVVDPSFEGQGVGSALAKGVLADIRARGLRVVVSCPFVKSYIERHPGEYDDILGKHG